MLRQLSIHNLAVVLHLELDFETGMTVLTGETGAGKSILIDALSLCLGARMEATLIRPGANNAEVSALFDIKILPRVLDYLVSHELIDSELKDAELIDIDGECIIRRVITQDGRSRSYINGHLVPLNQLRELGELLINIHGQHQHQTLLKTEYQRMLLDHFADNHLLLNQVQAQYQHLNKLKNEQKELLSLKDNQDKLALLQYQLQEFEELNLKPNEIEELTLLHKKLSHAEQWLLHCENIENILTAGESREEKNAVQLLHQALSEFTLLKNQFPQLQSCHEMVNNAIIQIEEASNELQNFRGSIHCDPNELQAIDARLSQIHALARKHRINPEQILIHSEQCRKETEKLQTLQEHLVKLEIAIQDAGKLYLEKALLLSQSRQKASKELSQLITQSIKQLEMQHGVFSVELIKNESKISPLGIDEIEFLVTTNPGLPPAPLRKIASGGELSRVSLAIQVITAQKMTTPTLIFDEVDVGVSGKTAEMVGKLLRKLGEHAQVLCVTHLPQVAALGNHHYKVEKLQTETSTSTRIVALDTTQRIDEVARILGGAKITKHTLAHAKEMLETV